MANVGSAHPGQVNSTAIFPGLFKLPLIQALYNATIFRHVQKNAILIIKAEAS
jgi:hypothetical protein